MTEKLEDKLQIILVTYNRCKKLRKTLAKILGRDSPIRNCSITILDNKSTDGTSELIEFLCKKHQNIVHIIHNRNIGGNANIARAFEIASMQYLWILCDDDDYDFSHFDEIKKAILSDKYDCILAERKVEFSAEDLPYVINTLAFVPSGIYKTKNITDTVMTNIEANIMYSFPHLMLGVHLLNINAKFCVPAHTIIRQQLDVAFTRGTNLDELHFRQKHTTLFSGYVNSYQMITDRKLRKECCDVLWLGKSFSFSVRAFLRDNGRFFPNIADFVYGIRGEFTTISFRFCLYVLLLFCSKKNQAHYFPQVRQPNA